MPDDFSLKIAVDDMVQELLGDTYEHRKSTAAAITPSGDIEPKAVRNALPWQRVDWYLESPTTGTNVSSEHPLPQGAVIRYVAIRAKVAPGGGQMLVSIEKGSGSPVTASLQAGMTAGHQATSSVCPPGSVLSLNVSSVNGASGVTVSAFYGID